MRIESETHTAVDTNFSFPGAPDELEMIYGKLIILNPSAAAHIIISAQSE